MACSKKQRDWNGIFCAIHKRGKCKPECVERARDARRYIQQQQNACLAGLRKIQA